MNSELILEIQSLFLTIDLLIKSYYTFIVDYTLVNKILLYILQRLQCVNKILLHTMHIKEEKYKRRKIY